MSPSNIYISYSHPCAPYLKASLLFEGSCDEHRVALDHGNVFDPPALRQFRVCWNFYQLQAHLLPQRTCQHPHLTLGLGEVSLKPVSTLCQLPKGLWDTSDDSMSEAAIWINIGHDDVYDRCRLNVCMGLAVYGCVSVINSDSQTVQTEQI